MHKTYFDIKDNCRKGLLKHLSKAISTIPVVENPLILDAGCGSGVPTLALAENYNGTITAVDVDTPSINRLKEKVKEQNLADRITILNCSLFDLKPGETPFDIILAEGLLNVTGFEKGFLKIISLLKRKGYAIIHDEYRDHTKKTEFIAQNNCKLITSFRLNEDVWWNDYYNCLEKAIAAQKGKDWLELFKTERHEIESFKQDPSPFNSVYYVVEKL